MRTHYIQFDNPVVNVDSKTEYDTDGDPSLVKGDDGNATRFDGNDVVYYDGDLIEGDIWSIGLRFKLNALTATSVLYGQRTRNPGSDIFAQLYVLADGTLNGIVRDDAGNTMLCQLAESISINQWYNVCLVRNENQLTLYLDGDYTYHSVVGTIDVIDNDIVTFASYYSESLVSFDLHADCDIDLFLAYDEALIYSDLFDGSIYRGLEMERVEPRKMSEKTPLGIGGKNFGKFYRVGLTGM